MYILSCGTLNAAWEAGILIFSSTPTPLACDVFGSIRELVLIAPHLKCSFLFSPDPPIQRGLHLLSFFAKEKNDCTWSCRTLWNDNIYSMKIYSLIHGQLWDEMQKLSKKKEKSFECAQYFPCPTTILVICLEHWWSDMQWFAHVSLIHHKYSLSAHRFNPRVVALHTCWSTGLLDPPMLKSHRS